MLRVTPITLHNLSLSELPPSKLLYPLQSSVGQFMKHLGLSEGEARSLIKLSASLAREAREEYLKENPSSAIPLIAGSVGPFGSQFEHELFTYTGNCVDTVTAQVCTWCVWCVQH